MNAWLEGWSCSLAGAGLSPEQLLTFSNAKSEFWLYLVEMLSKLTEHPDLQVRLMFGFSGLRLNPKRWWLGEHHGLRIRSDMQYACSPQMHTRQLFFEVLYGCVPELPRHKHNPFLCANAVIMGQYDELCCSLACAGHTYG